MAKQSFVVYFIYHSQYYTFNIKSAMRPTQKLHLYKSKQLIKYYDPYLKLAFRAQVQESLTKENLRSKFQGPFDVPAILYSFIRRNGLNQVKKRGRIDEIFLSLMFYSEDFLKIYQDYICHYEKAILRNIKTIPAVSYEPLIEHHLLPFQQSNGYYCLTSRQRHFVEDHFSTLDQYFCLKTLAYFGSNLSKIPIVFHEKYFKLKKWLFLHQSNEIPNVPLQSDLGFPNQEARNNFRVCIVGINFPNIVLGHKLAILGAYVMLVESETKKLRDLKRGYLPDFLKQGLYVANDADNNYLSKTIKQYLNVKPQLFKQQIQIQQLSRMNKIAENTYIEDTLFTILEEILTETYNNNKKPVWPEIVTKLSSRNSQRFYRRQELGHEAAIDPAVMLIFLQKYLIFNKIRDQQGLLVGDLRKYLQMYYDMNSANISKIKMGISNNTYYIFKPNLFQSNSHIKAMLTGKEKQINPYINLSAKFCKAQSTNQKWIVTLKSIDEDEIQYVQEFTHLIYSNSIFIEKAINSKNYVIEDVEGMYLKQGFPILQQLSAYNEIHCLYTFKEILSFRPINNKNIQYLNPTYAAYISDYGIIHFHLLNTKKEVLATMRLNKKFTYMDFYREIYGVLASNILTGNFMVQPNLDMAQCCTHFTLKDERFMDNLIKGRQEECLYFSLPVINASGPRNLIQSQMMINNKILEWIVRDLQRNQSFYQLKKFAQPKEAPTFYKAVKQHRQYHERSQQPKSMRVERSISKSKDKDPYYSKHQRPGNRRDYYGRQKQYDFDQRSQRQQRLQKVQRSQRSQRSQRQQRQERSQRLQRQSNDQMRDQSRRISRQSESRSSFRQKKSFKEEKVQQVSPNDYFGINHSTIRQYCSSVDNYTSRYRQEINGCKIYEGLYNMGSRIHKLSSRITNQYLYMSVFLYSLGCPALIGQLTRNKNDVKFFNFNRCITRRQYYSLMQPQKRTIYYQCIIVIKSKEYYCLVDESMFHNISSSNKQMVYYHTNMNSLQQSINATLKQRNQNISLSSQIIPTFLVNERLHILPEYILPSVIEALILKELQKNPSVDSILNQKLKGQSIIPDTCLSLYYQNPAKYIIKEVEAFLQSMLVNNKIKPYSLSDIFFGKIDSMFILGEMFESFGRFQGNEESKQMIQKARKINENKKYGLYIGYFEKKKSISLSRTFMNSERKDQCTLKSYTTQVSQNNPWLINYYQQNLPNNQSALQEIVRKCLNRYRSYQIVNFFKDLIYQQLMEIQKFEDQILAYYKMTRLINLEPMVEETNNFMNGIKAHLINNETDLNEPIISENYRTGNLKMIGSDILCLK